MDIRSGLAKMGKVKMDGDGEGILQLVQACMLEARTRRVHSV